MEAKQEQLEAKQNQLLEIYKLHTQIANNVSTRRTAINRFYQVILSGLTLIFLVLLQRKTGVIPRELSFDVINQYKLDSIIELFAVFLGFFGSCLAWLWAMTIDNYLRLNSRKYEVLKKLEAKLEYQFFTQEWELLGEKGKHFTYRRLAFTEILVPVAFNLFFTTVTLVGGFKTSHSILLFPNLIMSIGFLVMSFVILFRPDPGTK